jgi:hypothetical protein
MIVGVTEMEAGAEASAVSPKIGQPGVIASVTGHGTSRGIPEVHQVSIQMDDGSVLETRMPTPQGVKVSGGLLPVDVEYFNFGECPICLVPSPSSREHVPPHSIGGNVRTLTCERCNNEFGSRFEPHLQTWYEKSLGWVRISGGDVPGRRNGGEYLYRETLTGELVFFQTGRSDPNFDRMIQGGKIEITFPAFNEKAFRLAALKTAYVAACLIMKEVPRTERAAAIRAELMAARDRDRGEDYELSALAQSIQVSRTAADPVPGEIALVEMTEADGSTFFAVSFNRVFAVDWPLDPIFIREAGASDPSEMKS